MHYKALTRDEAVVQKIENLEDMVREHMIERDSKTSAKQDSGILELSPEL